MEKGVDQQQQPVPTYPLEPEQQLAYPPQQPYHHPPVQPAPPVAAVQQPAYPPPLHHQPPHLMQPGVMPQQPPPMMQGGQQQAQNTSVNVNLGQQPQQTVQVTATKVNLSTIALITAAATTLALVLVFWPGAICSGVGIGLAFMAREKLTRGEVDESNKIAKMSLGCTSTALSCTFAFVILLVIVIASN